MTEEEQIQKGFNAGYQLQRQDPKLARTLESGFADKDNPYAKGFSEGAKEYSKEQYFERIKDQFLSDSNELDHSKGLDQSNDQDLSL